MFKKKLPFDVANIGILPEYIYSNRALFIAWLVRLCVTAGLIIILFGGIFALIKSKFIFFVWFHWLFVICSLPILLYVFVLSGLCKCTNCSQLIFLYYMDHKGDHPVYKVIANITKYHYFICPKCGKSYRVKWKWENIKMNYDEPADKE